MGKVKEHFLNGLEYDKNMEDIYHHQNEQVDYQKSKIDDLKLRLREARNEIERLEEENAKLRDSNNLYRAHYDNGRV